MGFLNNLFEKIKEKNVNKVLFDSVGELLKIYNQNPGGFNYKSPGAEPVKKIGRKLDKVGGMELMLRAHEIFTANAFDRVGSGILNWCGTVLAIGKDNS